MNDIRAFLRALHHVLDATPVSADAVPPGTADRLRYDEDGHLIGASTRPASNTTGPCATCHRPTDRYGPHGTPLCPHCRKDRTPS